MMLTVLREGTTSRSAAAIADAQADLGLSFGWAPAQYASPNPGFTATKSTWKSALAIAADILMHPSFPPDAVTRVQGMQAGFNSPNTTNVPGRILTTQLFGVDHPYSVGLPSDSSIRRITREDLVDLQTKYLRPQNTVMVVVGDVTPAEARAAVESAFGSWQRTGAEVESKRVAPTSQQQPTTIYLRDFPGAATAGVWTAEIAPTRSTRDGMLLDIADATLGAGLAGTRLWDAFRVRRGLSYAPQTGTISRPSPQDITWMQNAQAVPTDKADTAVLVLLQTLREIRSTQPLTEAEVAAAKTRLVGRLPLIVETVDGLANRTFIILANRYPLTFYDDYIPLINGATTASAQAALNRYLDPDHLPIVVVGDRAKLEGPLRATGIPVVIVDPAIRP
jgi:zinc protease